MSFATDRWCFVKTHKNSRLDDPSAASCTQYWCEHTRAQKSNVPIEVEATLSIAALMIVFCSKRMEDAAQRESIKSPMVVVNAYADGGVATAKKNDSKNSTEI